MKRLIVSKENIEAVTNKNKSLAEMLDKVKSSLQSLKMTNKFYAEIDRNHNCIVIKDISTNQDKYHVYLDIELTEQRSYRWVPADDEDRANLNIKLYKRVRDELPREAQIQVARSSNVYEILKDVLKT